MTHSDGQSTSRAPGRAEIMIRTQESNAGFDYGPPAPRSRTALTMRSARKMEPQSSGCATRVGKSKHHIVCQINSLHSAAIFKWKDVAVTTSGKVGIPSGHYIARVINIECRYYIYCSSPFSFPFLFILFFFSPPPPPPRLLFNFLLCHRPFDSLAFRLLLLLLRFETEWARLLVDLRPQFTAF